MIFTLLLGSIFIISYNLNTHDNKVSNEDNSKVKQSETKVSKQKDDKTTTEKSKTTVKKPTPIQKPVEKPKPKINIESEKRKAFDNFNKDLVALNNKYGVGHAVVSTDSKVIFNKNKDIFNERNASNLKIFILADLVRKSNINLSQTVSVPADVIGFGGALKPNQVISYGQLISRICQYSSNTAPNYFMKYYYKGFANFNSSLASAGYNSSINGYFNLDVGKYPKNVSSVAEEQRALKYIYKSNNYVARFIKNSFYNGRGDDIYSYYMKNGLGGKVGMNERMMAFNTALMFDKKMFYLTMNSIANKDVVSNMDQERQRHNLYQGYFNSFQKLLEKYHKYL